MNPTYRRSVSAEFAQKMRRWEATTLATWAAVLAAIYVGALSYRVVILWYAALAVVSFLNTVRVLGAHAYETDGAPRDREGQLRDSIDTPGGPWTELWAPVGLRYHALHHYFPGIPYHNLGVAYRRILGALPSESQYRQSTSPSLRQSLKELYRKARLSGGAMARR
jgi:fatty acid desaturase